jgi:hypothetical protein
MYSLLLYSLIITLIIFGIFQYIEKNKIEKANETYDVNKHLLNANNAVIFSIMFISCFAIVYFVFGDNLDIMFDLGILENDNKSITIKDPLYNVKHNKSIDPGILKRINGPLKYGFEPYSGGSDMSTDAESNSSSESSENDSCDDE